jgi:hypothetical protein
MSFDESGLDFAVSGLARVEIGRTGWTILILKKAMGNISYYAHDCGTTGWVTADGNNTCLACNEEVPRQARVFLKLLKLKGAT